MTERQLRESDLAEALRIDRDDLDTCLVEQPGLFNQFGQRVVTANSRRDALKLQLEELEAELYPQFRSAALSRDEKMTEGAIHNQIILTPRYKDLQRQFLGAKAEADSRLVLKEAFLQRHYMLRELVAIDIAEMQNLQVERGATSARHRQGEAARARREQYLRDRDSGGDR